MRGNFCGVFVGHISEIAEICLVSYASVIQNKKQKLLVYKIEVLDQNENCNK